MLRLFKAVSTLLSVGFLASACGGMTATEEKSVREPPKTDDGTKTTGGLSLRMPKKKDKDERISILSVSLGRVGICHDGLPQTQEDEYSEETYGLRTVKGSERCESAEPQQYAYPEEEEDCEATESTTYEFKFQEGEVISIPDLRPGKYYVNVTLIDDEGTSLETGASWAYVEANASNYVEIVLEAVDGDGALDIGIIRAD